MSSVGVDEGLVEVVLHLRGRGQGRQIPETLVAIHQGRHLWGVAKDQGPNVHVVKVPAVARSGIRLIGEETFDDAGEDFPYAGIELHCGERVGLGVSFVDDHDGQRAMGSVHHDVRRG